MKILLVDDEQVLVEELVISLELDNHSVTSAENGHQCWERFRQSPDDFDVIVTDIKMPVMDGLELLKRLRDNNFDIPVIIMTGHGDLEISIEALRLGAFDFLLKPFDPDVLESSLFKLEVLQRQREPTTEIAPFVDRIQLSVPSKIGMILNMVDYLKNHYGPICRSHKIEINRFNLCLHEALTNALVHGNLEVPSSVKEESWAKFNDLVEARESEPQFSERTVLLNYFATDQQLVFEIEDEGTGFDISKLPDPGEPASMLFSGRGILLIRMFMDEVNWNTKGNKITMVKKLNAT